MWTIVRPCLRAPLLQVFLALLALRQQLQVHFPELRLGDLLSVVRVVAHQDQLLQVVLLRLQRALQRAQLQGLALLSFSAQLEHLIVCARYTSSGHRDTAAAS